MRRLKYISTEMRKPCQCYQFTACPSVPKSQVIRWLHASSWAHISFIGLLSWQLAWGSALWEWRFGWGRRENSSETWNSGDLSLKGMGEWLGTSLVGQGEAASGKPLGQGDKKKKRPRRWQWGQIGCCQNKLHPLGEFVLDLLLFHSSPIY